MHTSSWKQLGGTVLHSSKRPVFPPAHRLWALEQGSVPPGSEALGICAWGWGPPHSWESQARRSVGSNSRLPLPQSRAPQSTRLPRKQFQASSQRAPSGQAVRLGGRAPARPRARSAQSCSSRTCWGPGVSLKEVLLQTVLLNWAG